MPPEYRKDELEMLTDEELEGLQEELDDVEDDDEDGDDDSEAKAKAEDDDGDDDDDDEGGDTSDDDDAGADDGDDDSEAKADDEDAAADDDEEVDAGTDVQEGKKAAQPPQPVFQAPADLEEQMKALDKQLDELEEKFDDGEITAVERRNQAREIQNRIRELDKLQVRAEMSRDLQVQYWRTTVGEFLSSNPQYQAGTDLYSALDDEVRRLQSRTENPYDPGLLTQAHENLQARARQMLGLKDDHDTAPQKKPDEATQKGKKVPSAPKRELPPTLHGIPAAEITETDLNGEFAHLDKLTGVAYEEALARLTPEQQERYLSGA